LRKEISEPGSVHGDIVCQNKIKEV